MTIAKVGVARDQWHRYYVDGVGPLPGVTSVVGMLDKSGPLIGWARRETARYAVNNLETVAKMVNDFGADETIKTVKTVTDKEAKDKARIGTNVHAMVEEWLRADHENRDPVIRPTDEERPFIESFIAFESAVPVRWLTVEAMVCSLDYGYGGTLDGIGEIDGAITLVDVKTGATLQPSMRIQLAAYGHPSCFVGRPLDPKRYRLPKIERYALLHLRPEGYELVYQDVTTDDFEAFIACLRLWHWQQAQPDEWRDRKEGKAA
jgi:hypothetical protein